MLVVAAAAAVLVAGCSGADTADIYRVTPVGSSLDVLIGVCHPQDLQVTVDESPSEVRLRATFSSHAEGQDCAVSSRVQLQSPLTGRTVVDDGTGDAVPVDE